jgi:DNA mismatch repair ATPase MutS
MNYHFLIQFGYPPLSEYNQKSDGVIKMGTKLHPEFKKELNEINARLNTVDALIRHQDASEQIAIALKQCGDMERIISKISLLEVI